MFYEYIINKNTSNLQDVSLCELEIFIKKNKSHILEIVYEYLNTSNENVPNKKEYYTFLEFIKEIKKTKERSHYFFDFLDNSICDVCFEENVVWDLSQDIQFFKKCNIQKSDKKTEVIKSIFKIE